MSGKRAFPFYSEVQGFELQRRRLEEDPSRRAPEQSLPAAAVAVAARSAPASWMSGLARHEVAVPCREKEAPKVWQAREHSTLDDYDAITVGLGARAACSGSRQALPDAAPC